VNQLSRVRHAVFEMPGEQEEAIPEAHAQSAAPAPQSAKPQDAETSPRMLRTTHLTVNSMKVEDAVMQMNLMNNDFYVFHNAETNAMSVLYRRKDGQYGLIEPHAPEAAAPAIAAAK
jgi:putative sigma-54 modulation protein